MRRVALTIAAVLCLALHASATITSTYLWDAVDAQTVYAYNYNVSAIYDNDAGRYRAYWVTRDSAFDPEGVKTQSNTSPWNLYPSSPDPNASAQSWALLTTGVRITRVKSGSDYRDLLNQMQTVSQLSGTYGYSEITTLGFLRRTSHSSSHANTPLYECVNGSDYFVSGNPGVECSGGYSLLGYAYDQSGTGLALRYRCFNGSEHFTSTTSDCESKSGYSSEGPVGYWRTGTTWSGNGDDVSPFGDGALLAPNSVIKDDDGTFYMAYTASPYYGNLGPFNQIFLATSSDGVTFTPYVDSSTGLPLPMQSYDSSYVSDVTGRGNGNEYNVAFGVGAGTLIKEGSGSYRIFFMDSSRYSNGSSAQCSNSNFNPQTGGTVWRWVTRTASSPTGFTSSPGTAGTCLKTLQSDDTEVDSYNYVNAVGGLPIVYDGSRYWLYRTANSARTAVAWHGSKVGSPTEFYISGTYSGSVDAGSTIPNKTASGAVTNRYGMVGSSGWYVYVGHTHSSCDPTTDITCGISHAAITQFNPQ